MSRGSRWVHYGPSGSKVARKDLTASRSQGTLGLWGGDKGGAAGRLSGQRQDNGRGVGGGAAAAHREEQVPDDDLLMSLRSVPVTQGH